MTKIITGFILISLLLASLRVQAQHCDIDSLNARFVTMKQKDQDIRKELMKAVSQYQKDGSGQMNLLTLSGKMKAQDQQNQAEPSEPSRERKPQNDQLFLSFSL